MPDLTPAGDLRAAARLIRETAAKATPGPWSASPVWSPRATVTSAVYSYAHPAGAAASEVIPSRDLPKDRRLVRPGDAAWIALANPALAEPLAAWLEDAAQDLAGAMVVASKWPVGGSWADPMRFCDEPDSARRALAIARALTPPTGPTEDPPPGMRCQHRDLDDPTRCDCDGAQP